MLETKRAASKAAALLKTVSILETISFLILLTMMIRHSETGVSVAGAVHGFLFLWYAVLVWRDRTLFGWSPAFLAVAILTGPLGAIVVLERLRRHPAV